MGVYTLILRVYTLMSSAELRLAMSLSEARRHDA